MKPSDVNRNPTGFLLVASKKDMCVSTKKFFRKIYIGEEYMCSSEKTVEAELFIQFNVILDWLRIIFLMLNGTHI